MKRAMTILLAVLLLAAAAQMISPPGAAADPGNAPPTPPAIGSPSAVGGTPGGRNLPPTVPVIAMPTGNAPVIAVPTGSAPTPPPIVAAPTIAPLPTIAATIPVTATSVPATRNAPPTVAPTPTSGATPTGTGTGTAAPTVCPTGTATGTPITTATGTLTATATHAATGTATACATVTAPTAPLTTATASAAPVAPTACPATNTLTGQTAALVPPALAQREVTGSRTRTTRTYNAGKGQLQTVIGSGSLNFKDTQGKWQPIDNTLVAGAASGYAYQNKANGYTAAFPGGLAANPVRVTRGNAWVSFALAGANGTSTTCANQIVYANALPGVAVTYAAENDAVTETLTLASAVAPNAYPFAVRTSGDLTARAAKNGGIQFVDKAGTVVFTFAPPTMHDSAKKRATGTVSLQLATTNGGTTATIVADTAWLKDPARVYPVIIDPNTQINPAQECLITGGDPTNMRCAGGPLGLNSVKWDPTNGGDHSLLQFDTSAFNSNFVITGAYVYMNLRYIQDPNGNDIPSGSYNTVSVRRLKRSWSADSVTWNSPWTHPGAVNSDNADSDGAADTKTVGNLDVNTVSSGTNGDGQFYNCTFGYFCGWTVTDVVQGWINGTYANDGLLFEDDQAHNDNTDDMDFCTANCSDPNGKPFLSITYDDPGSTGSTGPAIGGRPFYTLVGGQIDDRLSLGVNVQSGNLLVTANDLTIAGTGLNLAVTRSYNSLAVYKGIFGNHWAMNGGPDLFVLILPNTNDVILQNNTGYRVGFTDNGNGNYQHVPGLDADLYRYGDGSYTLTYHANNFQYRFDNTGRLTWQQDKNGNRINYAYNGTQLDHIEDTEGRWVRFEYGGGTNGKYVSHIHDDYGNRDVYYGYQGDNLHQVTDANGGVTYFDYDTGSGNLQRITDPRTNVTTFGYTGGALSRVQDIGRPGIPTTHLDYPSGDGTGAGSTVVTDPNGHGVFLQYDTHGLVTHTDQYGHTTDYLYNDDYHVTSAKDGYGNETRYQYNAGDSERLTDTYLPTGAHASTSYGGCNQPTPYYACGMTDAQGHSVRYGYSGFNVSDVTNDLGGTVHTDYDGQGRPTAARDARGNTTHYGYGGPGAPHHELSQITPPYVAPNTLGNNALAYDNVSRKTSVMDGKGQVTQYSYDNLDRPQMVTYSGNDAITYRYDGNGNLTDRQEGAGLTHFVYDALNRQTSKRLPTGPYLGDGNSVDYGYDNAGNLIALTDTGGTVQYAYDQWNLLDHLVEPNLTVTSFGYDNNNVHTRTTYPGGTTLTLDHDTAERLTAITGVAGGRR